MNNDVYADNCNSYFQPEYSMIGDIEEYIQNELKDSMYYFELSKKAPSQMAKDLLEEFSKDEKTHAEGFVKAYGILTGLMFHSMDVGVQQIPEYSEALKSRFLSETSESKKYSDQYLKTRNQFLKDLFFSISSSEAQHAMKILLLMCEA
ncbi:MAG: ferritin-like domain-containing protein [Clostridia bacterium]|nr:ferritin-like domain-containing protein [Clostridia bacterium]